MIFVQTNARLSDDARREPADGAMLSYVREELQALREEFRSAYRRQQAELHATQKSLADMQSERRTRKAMLDRCMRLVSLIVAVGTLVALILRDLK